MDGISIVNLQDNRGQASARCKMTVRESDSPRFACSVILPSLCVSLYRYSVEPGAMVIIPDFRFLEDQYSVYLYPRSIIALQATSPSLISEACP